MTEARPKPSPSRRPGSGPVFWTSLLLFCVLLGLLTYRFSIGEDPSGATPHAAAPAPVRKVIVRRVVTTLVPAGSGAATAGAGSAEPPVAAAPVPESEAVPVSEPVTSSS